MTLRLVDSRWAAELTAALQADSSALQIICPFIKNKKKNFRPVDNSVATKLFLAQNSQNYALRSSYDACVLSALGICQGKA